MSKGSTVPISRPINSLPQWLGTSNTDVDSQKLKPVRAPPSTPSAPLSCPPPPCPPPPGGETVTGPMNNKKSIGNHRRPQIWGLLQQSYALGFQNFPQPPSCRSLVAMDLPCTESLEGNCSVGVQEPFPECLTTTCQWFVHRPGTSIDEFPNGNHCTHSPNQPHSPTTDLQRSDDTNVNRPVEKWFLIVILGKSNQCHQHLYVCQGSALCMSHGVMHWDGSNMAPQI